MITLVLGEHSGAARAIVLDDLGRTVISTVLEPSDDQRAFVVRWQTCPEGTIR
jgi:hypothetical protein